MSGHQFTFPPPPPPPPKVSQTYPGAPQPFAGPNGSQGKGNSKDHRDRGYCRNFNRDGGRSRHFGSTQSNSSYGNPSLGIDKGHSSLPSMGFNIRTNDYRKGGYPLPRYPPVQLSQSPINVRQGYGPQNQAFPANAPPLQAADLANGGGSYQAYNEQNQYTLRGYGPSPPTIQAALPAAQNNRSFQINVHAGQPVLMGPPIRMGFDARRTGSQTQQHAPPTANGTKANQQGLSDGNESPYRHNSTIGFHFGSHESPTATPGNPSRGQKRGRGEIYGRPRNQNQRTQISPAVPSFGGQLPLPLKPPALHGITRKPRKKKRKNNQLGLTPNAEEHESSEEENDTDEEVRLAAVAASTGQGHQLLQFDYKGRTSTLQSSSDITAWIEERKKRFPTKARVAEIAEAKRQCDIRQRAADQVSRKAQEEHRSQVQKMKRRKTEADKQQKKDGKPSEDAAAKSRRKVEKLRKQLEKEEKRIARAEANASRDKVQCSTEASKMDISDFSNEGKKRKRSDSGGSGNAKIGDNNLMKPKLQEAASIVPDPLTPTSQPALADEERYPLPKALNTAGQVNSPIGQEDDQPSFPDLTRLTHNSSVSESDSSADSSSTESKDSTSSSGSSSDSDGDEGAPDKSSSRRQGLERIAPPKRANSGQICRAFLHKGLCKRGSCCKYLHELPARGSRGVVSQEVKKSEEKKERVGLYRRLVEQEKDQEDHKVVEAILHLGEKELLEKSLQAVDEEGEVS